MGDSFIEATQPTNLQRAELFVTFREIKAILSSLYFTLKPFPWQRRLRQLPFPKSRISGASASSDLHHMGHVTSQQRMPLSTSDYKADCALWGPDGPKRSQRRDDFTIYSKTWRLRSERKERERTLAVVVCLRLSQQQGLCCRPDGQR